MNNLRSTACGALTSRISKLVHGQRFMSERRSQGYSAADPSREPPLVFNALSFSKIKIEDGMRFSALSSLLVVTTAFACKSVNQTTPDSQLKTVVYARTAAPRSWTDCEEV